MQYEANLSDFFGNNVRFEDINNRNFFRTFIFGANNSEWQRTIRPTTINGFYQAQLNQFCKFKIINEIS